MADLGDLTGFLKGGSLVDIDWLDVNEEDYRALDRLPKQNLDIAPDLQAVWSHEDKPAEAYLVGNTGDTPRTLADLKGETSKVASDLIERISNVARFALMESTDLGHFRDALMRRFDKQTLRLAKDALKAVYEERGLIGKLYVNASDFPEATNPKSAQAHFLRKYASNARFVVVKPGAKNVRAFKSPTGVDVCSVFHKEIVLQVPYTEELARSVEKSQMSRGKVIQASTASPRERIRAALAAPDFQSTPLEAPKPVVDPLRFMQATVAPKKVHLKVVASTTADAYEEAAAGVFSGELTPDQADQKFAKASFDKKATEVTSFLRREMLRGRGEKELIRSLKVAFSTEDLKSTRLAWEPLFREAGLFGTVYSTQDSFSECRDGADFLAKHNPSVRGIVAGNKCDGCIYNKMARCLIYGKPLAKEASDLMTEETVSSVIREHRQAGRLETGADKVTWGTTPVESLKTIYRVASTTNAQTQTRIDVYKVFTGAGSSHIAAGLTRREIVKTASRYLNEGLYGVDLLSALKRRFDPRDIVAAKADLRPVLAEQGLQGIYYVDPAIYSDYGKGCDEAERLHRSRGVPYVKAASKCGSCIHQRKAGFCSKLNKELVSEVPYADKAAQQREILASGASTEVTYASLINNGASMIDEFQLQGGGMSFDLNAETSIPELSVEVVAGQKVKV